jgi:hypothetical protein
MSDTKGWGRLVPDVRGWAIMGFFALTFDLLWMINHNPALLKDASFMQFAQTLATGGILLVASNLFGGTKSGAETNSALAAAIPPLAPLMSGLAPVAVTVANTPADPVPVSTGEGA